MAFANSRVLVCIAFFLALKSFALAQTTTSQQLCPTYTVKQGDGLTNVVQSAQAMGLNITMAQLMSTLTQYLGWTSSSTLQANQVLPLPGYTQGCQFVVDSGSPTCLAYLVQQNDSVASIAQSLGISATQLQQLNKQRIPSTGVPTPGTYLLLPGWDAKTCQSPETAVTECQVYTVQAGDSISNLATLYKLNYKMLLSLNSLSEANASSIQPGQTLKFPPWPAKCDSPSNQQPAKLPGDTAKQCRVAAMQSNQGLYSLAMTYGKTLEEILANNPGMTNATVLQLGAIVAVDNLCNCTTFNLVGNGTLPSSWQPSHTGCSAAPAPAPTPAATSSELAPVLAPAPAALPTKVVISAPAASNVAAQSSAVGVKPVLALGLALLAGTAVLLL